MKKPSFKKGDGVYFFTSSKVKKSGEIIGIVKAGETPDLTKKDFYDLHKRGLSQAKARDKKSYLVSDGVQLYWPKEVF